MDKQLYKEGLRLLSLFSGIGAYEEALSNLGVEYNLINYCEFDDIASDLRIPIFDCGKYENMEGLKYSLNLFIQNVMQNY